MARARLTLPLSGSLWMGGRSEWTRPASLQTTAPAGTEVALLEAEASSEGDAAGAAGSPEVSAGGLGLVVGPLRELTDRYLTCRGRRPGLRRWPL